MTRPTRLGRSFQLTTLSDLGDGGLITSGGEDGVFPGSGTVPTATGSNTWAWASNVARITSNTSNTLLGPFVNFASDTGIIFSVASNTLTIGATGGGGGSLTVKDEGSTTSTTVTILDFTGAGVTASGGGATATITIPGGGSSSDDTIPSGGTLYDGTSTSGWTQFGSGGLTTFDADSTVPGALYLAKTTAGNNNDYGVYRAIGGSLPRTYTCRVKAADVYTNYQGFGLMLGDSTPTVHFTWGVTRDSNQSFGLFLQRYAWTSPTSSGANVVYAANSAIGLRPQIPTWLRLVANSSSSVDLQASVDGYLYYTMANYNPGFTIATFGLFIFTFNNAVDVRAAFDWVHET